jgi:hypothetical protein
MPAETGVPFMDQFRNLTEASSGVGVGVGVVQPGMKTASETIRTNKTEQIAKSPFLILTSLSNSLVIKELQMIYVTFHLLVNTSDKYILERCDKSPIFGTDP